MNRRPSPRTLQAIILVLVVAGVLLLSLSGLLSRMVNSSSTPLVSAQRWFSSRYAAIRDFLTVPRDVATLRQQNAALQNEVSQLQGQIIQLQQQLSEAQILYALLDFARARPENQYVGSLVIGRDPNPFMHYIFIDHGSDSGVVHGMPVVTQQGLIGKVSAVTAGGARVQLITDPTSVVNIRLQSLKIEAQLVGSLTGELTVEMIPQDLVVKPGELILTSGLGGEYPADIVIGQIISVRKQENDLFQSATVQPVIDFSTLRAVLVITNFQPVELLPLEPTQAP